jgi:hypothetical protein
MAPQSDENLLLYITATTHVVSTAIMVERQEEGHAFGVQQQVYFISEVLSESMVRYPTIQKLLYGYTHHLHEASPLFRRIQHLGCNITGFFRNVIIVQNFEFSKTFHVCALASSKYKHGFSLSRNRSNSAQHF